MTAIQDVRLRDSFGGLQTGGNMTTLVDVASTTVTYVGKAQVGTLESESKWQIKKVLVSGTVTKIAFAGGSDNFVNSWANRASLTYPTT